MNNELVSIQQTGMLEVIQDIIEQSKDYISQAKAPNTIKSYRSDWNHFTEWCMNHGLKTLPASQQTVSIYITTLAQEGRKASTIQRRISAISQAHQAAGFESPTKSSAVRTVWAGIRRVHGAHQQGKAPAVIEDIRAMIDTLPDNLLGTRDRAMLLIGFAGAFRRSELVSLNVEDIEVNREGLVIHLRKSKTDQEGLGRKIGIPYGSNIESCPVRSYQAWIEASGIKDGAIFRHVNRHGKMQDGRLSDKAVALVVKRCALAAGLDPKKYAGHSLRAGLATTAAMLGKSERAIMAQTGHRSVNMVRKYIRDGSIFRDNAAAGIGL